MEIIQELFTGEYVSHRGGQFEVDSAKLWDLPEQPPPIGIAISGRQSAAIAGELADLVVAVEPRKELIRYFAEAGESGKPSYGQLPLSFDPDEGVARRRAHQQFRWFSGGWKVNAELPGTAAFAAASRMVTEDDVAERIPCGPDVDRHLDGIRRFAEAASPIWPWSRSAGTSSPTSSSGLPKSSYPRPEGSDLRPVTFEVRAGCLMLYRPNPDPHGADKDRPLPTPVSMNDRGARAQTFGFTPGPSGLRVHTSRRKSGSTWWTVLWSSA